MSGRLLRSVCTAALAAATLLVAVPFPAYAAPEPPPPLPPVPSAPSASAPAAGALGAPPATVSGLLGRLQLLYRQTEQATEAYNATEVELIRQRVEAKKLAADLARARAALERSRGDAGLLARRQYQGQSDLSDYLRLLLSPDAAHILDDGHLLERVARSRARTMRGLTAGEQRADALASASRTALDRQQQLVARQKKQRDTVGDRLREVEKLLASLSGTEIASIAALEKSGTERAQRELIGSGALGDTVGAAGAPGAPGAPAGARGTPSAAGGRAVEFAAGQIGKPYEWGAEGPGSYDCSGLTSQAWAHAGLAIPRTSQEQWRDLPRIPLRELRPGDLVIYFPEATHVAIYLGDGMVIQAPRPGAYVKVSPIAANPLLGAVRPDPDGAALAPGTYSPPALPQGATEGSDAGFGES
ncbi:C40 family peptidase [Streptomyces sp. JV176]|uniref:C40 family peptidase n=1 Tax=Streptomyces sp. JV176 TaxID=858630 RepID=UPI002E779AA2|nr:C40 family peptidase [Streptomyces sp. JV176]MEE1804582.1 C40 family peptidase [Streptomyces sp. JV176]